MQNNRYFGNQEIVKEIVKCSYVISLSSSKLWTLILSLSPLVNHKSLTTGGEKSAVTFNNSSKYLSTMSYALM